MTSDFTPECVATLRRLTGEQEWRTAFQLSWSARKLNIAAVRETLERLVQAHGLASAWRETLAFAG